MVAPRRLGADADDNLDPRRAQERDGRCPATRGSGSSSAETTRATPAATIASAQGGVAP